jgi:fatty acid-binding protein DegV
MKIAITADSVIDLTVELLNEYDIKIIPLNILLGDVDYKDNQVSSSDIFDFVAKNYDKPFQNYH